MPLSRYSCGVKDTLGQVGSLTPGKESLGVEPSAKTRNWFRLTKMIYDWPGDSIHQRFRLLSNHFGVLVKISASMSADLVVRRVAWTECRRVKWERVRRDLDETRSRSLRPGRVRLAWRQSRSRRRIRHCAPTPPYDRSQLCLCTQDNARHHYTMGKLDSCTAASTRNGPPIFHGKNSRSFLSFWMCLNSTKLSCLKCIYSTFKAEHAYCSVSQTLSDFQCRGYKCYRILYSFTAIFMICSEPTTRGNITDYVGEYLRFSNPTEMLFLLFSSKMYFFGMTVNMFCCRLHAFSFLVF